MSEARWQRTWWSCTKLLSRMGMDGRHQVATEADAILVSSLTTQGLHAPCLDFDFPMGVGTWWDGVTAVQLSMAAGRELVEPPGWQDLHDLLVDAGLTQAYQPTRDPRHFRFIVPVWRVPSSHPEHNHFYIDAQITWPTYVGILELMRGCGFLQKGFVACSIEREMTMLLKPRLKKDDLAAMGVQIAPYEPAVATNAPDAEETERPPAPPEPAQDGYPF